MTALKRAARGIGSRAKGSPRAVGVIVLAAVLLFGYAAFNKDEITTALTPGDTIQAEFDRAYKWITYRSDVKVADVDVGTITEVAPTDRGTVLVSMKVDEGILENLGPTPSATARATTLLGGTYYISLIPGGGERPFTGGLIPAGRTTTPVELGGVLTALTPQALEGVQSTIRQMNATLEQGGNEAIRKLLVDAPPTLKPAGKVLNALRGTRPGTDLTRLVRGLEATADGLLQNQSQLSALFADLDRATAALAAGSEPLAESIETSAVTMRTTRAGLTDLQGTLARLTSTAESLQPTAAQLDSLLAELDPVLVRAKPVVNDLRVLLEDARPLVNQLIPTVDKAQAAMTDVRGPVLNRVNGEIADLVLNDWHGTGKYAGGGNNNKFYEETAFLAVAGALAWQTHDGNTVNARLMASAGGQTIGGAAFPKTLEQYLEVLGFKQPDGPQPGPDGLAPGPSSETEPSEGPR